MYIPTFPVVLLTTFFCISSALSAYILPVGNSELAPLSIEVDKEYPLVLPFARDPVLAPLQDIHQAVESEKRLPSYPVAARNPYLNAWLFGNSTDDLTSGTVNFWHGQTLGLQVAVRINGRTYALLGYPASGKHQPNRAFQKGLPDLSASHTTTHFDAGGCDVALDFFNPVSPRNFIRQSFPYSYITVDVACLAVDVEVYVAIDDAWTAQPGQVDTNFTVTADGLIYSQMTGSSTPFIEHREMATWGTFALGARASSANKLSYHCGAPADLLSTFEKTGTFGNGSCSSGDWVAIAQKTTVVTNQPSMTFALGLSRDVSIDYLGAPQMLYYRTKYPTLEASLGAFLDDHSAANEESIHLEQTLRSHGDRISINYTDILHASLVQTFAAAEITIDAASKDNSTLAYFVKEISSDGNLNTLDIFYPTHTAWLALNPSLIKYSLLPLLRFLKSPNSWQENFAPHDMGLNYPNATGYKRTIHVSDPIIGETPLGNFIPEYMPVQSTSILLTLLYTYQKYTNDTAFALPYKSILTPFANYLVANGTAWMNQLSTVDGLGFHPNQTMLAVSSAIALQAFGKTYNDNVYTQAGLTLADRLWNQKLGTDPAQSHFTYIYNQPDSWSVIFPLLSDKLLGLNTFPQEAYDAQSDWYDQQVLPLGLQYVYNSSFSISDWAMWAAATSKPAAADKIVNGLRAYLGLPSMTNNHATLPFQTKYCVQIQPKTPGDHSPPCSRTGLALQNVARSTVGSNFALAIFNGTWSW